MSTFHVEIKTDNAAFQNGNREEGIIRILHRVMGMLEAGIASAKVRDKCGNVIGNFYETTEEN